MKKPYVVYVALNRAGHPVGVTRLASEAREWAREAKQLKLDVLVDNEFTAHAVEQYNLVIVEKPRAKQAKSHGR